MHIVIVCDFGEVNGGAAKVAISSATSLAYAGHTVTYICAIGPISILLDHPRITAHCLDFDNVWALADPIAAATQAIWNRRAREALTAIFEEIPIEGVIVHIHQWTKAFSPSILDIAAKRSLPTVVSLHDYFIMCPNGAYYHYRKAEICRLKPMSLACIASNCDRSSYAHKLIRVLRQKATHLAVARARDSLAFLSVSPIAERVVARYLPRDHARYIVRSPIEVEREEPVAVGLNTQFLFLGRLTEEKGVRLLANAAFEADLPLTIAGDGPLFDELSRIQGCVRCTGWLDEIGVAEIMKQARALVFPSTWRETGGLVVLEALARGIPVIVSRVTAPVDFVEDGVNGFIIDPADRFALIDRMRRLNENETAIRMGIAAYQRYWDDPQTRDRHTDELLSIYREMMSAHCKPMKTMPSHALR